MAKIGQFLRYTSWPIVFAMVTLMVFGVLAIHALEQANPNELDGYTTRQIIYACVGLFVFLIAAVVPYRVYGMLSQVIYGVMLLMLVAVLFTRPVEHATRWFDFKIARFQPAEAAKLAYVILLAWYLRFGDHYRKATGLILPFVLTFIPMVLILREPDLGTCLLFLPALYGMLFMAGAKLRHLLGVMVLATAMLLLPIPWRVPADIDAASLHTREATAYGRFSVGKAEYLVMPAPLLVVKPYQAQRVVGWLHQSDERLSLKLNYQLNLSKMTLGSGGLAGRADWHESYGFLKRLPDHHTDFVFAVIGGRWGFLGCGALLFLYAVIFIFGMEIALVTTDPFGRLLVVGVLSLLMAQLVINISMTMGLMPITGMTLPLVSYGGSSMVVSCAGLGLLVNVGERRPLSLAPRPFEHGERLGKRPGIDPWIQQRKPNGS